MNYDEALEWLFNVRRFGPERTLGPTFHLLELMGNPQEGYGTIHVGGTNGKGSTSAMRRNRAVTDMYEPGSVFKIVATSAALNEGVVDIESTLFCENGEYRYGSRVLRDVHGYGDLLGTPCGTRCSSRVSSTHRTNGLI